MQSIYAARRAWPGPLAMALVLLGLLAMPVPAQAAPSQAPDEVAMAAAGWHGRAIQQTTVAPTAGRRELATGLVGQISRTRNRLCPGRVAPTECGRFSAGSSGLGYRPGPVDGLFGPRTRAATRWFQYKHGLALTGRVSRATLAVLQARSDHKPLPVVTTGAPTSHRHSPTPVQPTPPVRAPAVPEDQTGATWLIAAGLLTGCARTRCGRGIRDPRTAAGQAGAHRAGDPRRRGPCRPRPPARPRDGRVAPEDTRPHNLASRRRLCARETRRTPTPTRPRRRWRFAAHTGAGRSWRSSRIAATPAAASSSGQGWCTRSTRSAHVRRPDSSSRTSATSRIASPTSRRY